MIPIINEITVAPKIVRITNWRPTTLNANAKRINALTVRQYTGNVEIPRPVLISPSGNKFLLKVSDDGTLSTERV